jgi:phosphoribosyl 1,2-cyclic phosphate phosphodiesterase
VCLSPSETNKRLRCSAILRPSSTSADETISEPSLLIDIGPDFRQQAIRADISKLDGILLTHAHADHILGLDDLRAFQFIHKEPNQVYGDAATLAGLKKVFSYLFQPSPSYKGGLMASIETLEVTPPVAFELAGKTVQPFSLTHGAEDIVGYRFGSLAYATDCNSIPDESKEIIKGADTLVLDGLRHRPHPTHFTIEEAIKAADELAVSKVYLTHLSHDVDYQAVSETLPGGVFLCYDGLNLPLNW